VSVPARLQELADRFGLPATAPAQLEQLLALVAAEPQALTTVRDPALAVELHVADSLAALDLPELRAAQVIADLGSGGGFPGLVLAVALPQAQVTLVESVGKKAAFLARVATELGLAHTHVQAGRAEAWSAGRDAADVVTARALAPLGVLLEYAAPLLRPGGTLVAWKAAPPDAELTTAAGAAATLGMTVPAARAVPAGVVRGADARSFYLSSRVGPLPAGYPRRPGMARKRPLGAST
jgi:16S rRNA (guanine527-N7)-methyltransferase